MLAPESPVAVTWSCELRRSDVDPQRIRKSCSRRAGSPGTAEEVPCATELKGKALQFGGGAFNGYLRQSDGRGHTVLGDKGKPTPLAEGYATFGSDSGHHKRYLLLPDIFNLANADFGVNAEEQELCFR